MIDAETAFEIAMKSRDEMIKETTKIERLLRVFFNKIKDASHYGSMILAPFPVRRIIYTRKELDWLKKKLELEGFTVHIKGNDAFQHDLVTVSWGE